MKAKFVAGGIVLVLLVGGVTLWQWSTGRDRRESAKALENLAQCLYAGQDGALLQAIIVPQTMATRSLAEQSELLTKALRDEVSPEGVAVLRQQAMFGPLKDIFPAECDKWSQAAGVRAEDCVAFKLERNGLRAEAVLLKPAPTTHHAPGGLGYPLTTPPTYRVLRVNNIKQLADSQLLTMEKDQ